MNAAEPPLFRRMLRSWILRGVVIFLALVYGWFAFNEWRWERKWEQYVAESRARGVKLYIGEFLPKEPIPDEENFAATPIWRQIFSVGNPDGSMSAKFKAIQAPRTKAGSGTAQPPPSAVDLPAWRASMVAAKKLTSAEDALTDGAAVLRGLEFLKPELDEIRASVKRPKVRFPVKWEEGFSVRLPHYSTFQALARFLRLSAAAKLAEGDGDGAFDDWQTGWNLARKLDDEPSLIGSLVQMSAMHIAISTMKDALNQHRWTPGQLEASQEMLAATNLIRRAIHCVSSERALLNASFEANIGKADMLAAYGGGITSPALDSVSQVVLKLRARTRNWWRQNQLWMNRFTDEELTFWDGDAELMALRPRKFGVENLSGFWVRMDLALVVYTAPIYSSTEKRFLHTHATVRMAGLACALERYRIANARYPERLEELVPQFIGKLPHDPCDGQPFRYRIVPEGYLLYSVGMDRKDDGGEVKGLRDADSGPDWRWWPPER